MKRSLALALALLPPVLLANAQDPAMPLCPPGDFATMPENPDGDRAGRLATLAQWERQGMAPMERLRVGALHRLGPYHPAGLVEADLQKARDVLAQAALDGQLLAMASSAELELKHGDAMTGMVWAQLFSHFMQRARPAEMETYQAHLIKRAFEALPSGEETDRRVGSNVQAVLDSFGARIEAGLASNGPDGSVPPAGCRDVTAVYPLELKSGSRSRWLSGGVNAINRHRLHHPGVALFLLQVDPDGKVAQVAVVESLPGPEVAAALRGTVQGLRFNAVAAEAPPRTAFMPMTFDDNSVRIRR